MAATATATVMAAAVTATAMAESQAKDAPTAKAEMKPAATGAIAVVDVADVAAVLTGKGVPSASVLTPKAGQCPWMSTRK